MAHVRNRCASSARSARVRVNCVRFRPMLAVVPLPMLMIKGLTRAKSIGRSPAEAGSTRHLQPLAHRVAAIGLALRWSGGRAGLRVAVRPFLDWPRVSYRSRAKDGGKSHHRVTGWAGWGSCLAPA